MEEYPKFVRVRNISLNTSSAERFTKAYEIAKGNANLAARQNRFDYAATTYKAVWKKLGLMPKEKKLSNLEKKAYAFCTDPSIIST